MNRHPERPMETTSIRARCALVGLAVLVLVPLSARADPRADYASLFGEEEKKVLATGFTKDDAAFAAKLLSRAADLKDAPDLQKLVLQRAVDLGQKDADGLATAIDAAKQLIATTQGAEKLDWRSKLVDLYAAQYKRATGAKRAEAGEFLLGILQKEADDLAADAKYVDAVKRLNEGRDIARSIKSSRVDEFVNAAKELQARQQTAEKYDRLRQKLDQQGGDVALLEQVILGYLLEVGDVDTAKKLAAGHPDKGWAEILNLTDRAKAGMSEDDHLRIAKWYRELAERLQGDQRAATLMIALYGFADFLAIHEKQDAVRLQADEAYQAITKELVASASSRVDRIVVYNTHNAQHKDRGATLLNVSVYVGTKSVWRRDGIRIPWAPNSDPSVTIIVPTRNFERVRIEVAEFYMNGSGISEVQVISRGRNIALNKPVKTSGTLQDMPVPAPERVTDGITSSAQKGGYWCGPNFQPAWIEIDLGPAKSIGPR